MRAIGLTFFALALLSSSLVAQADLRRLRTANLSFHVKHDSTGALTVSWDANTTDADLAGYHVYRGTLSGSYDSRIYVGNITKWPARNLITGREYFFVVTASDFSGNESGFSAEVSARAAAPTETFPPGTLQISNLNRYSEFLFTAGASVYSDRVYLIEDAGDFEGAQGIRTANGDKLETAADWVSFDVSVASDVVVAYDVRVSTPSWLSTFSRAGFSVLVDGCGELEAWVARFPAGPVQLGANAAGTSLSCMYLIAVRGVK